MKKYVFILVLAINISCNAQNKPLMIPEIDNKFEKFDSVKFNESKKQNPNVLREFLYNGTYIEKDQGTYGKGYLATSPNSYYTITKIYYPNGNIKSKGISLNTGTFKKGVWYEFDEQGNLIKETDYDKPFTFTFEDILKFCEKHGIKINKGPILQNTGWHNDIFRDIQNGHPIWRIEYLKKADLVEVIKIDGVTGKVLETSSYGYINN
ncbi:toxin-antitoxin system YwqK family antitoxin [Chryseobacterium vrystaatense]|uniref:MORN repeat variant n=1 Tax=Chryseobacterium vrystaatense TaxID=307480 RepID=A0A1M5PZ27_9FLAO|nr:hypothetical protein [Chryseobacterium vrystaatense]SHH06791.1 hypothetical protein SAMN02787073_0199 [Chryseobacterium vrystaatense]